MKLSGILKEFSRALDRQRCNRLMDPGVMSITAHTAMWETIAVIKNALWDLAKEIEKEEADSQSLGPGRRK